MLFLDNGKLAVKTNIQDIKLFGLLAELHLYQKENPINYTAGVDYFGVLNGSAMLKPSVDNVCKKWQEYFPYISVGDVSQNEHTLSIPVVIKTRESNTTYTITASTSVSI